MAYMVWVPVKPCKMTVRNFQDFVSDAVFILRGRGLDLNYVSGGLTPVPGSLTIPHAVNKSVYVVPQTTQYYLQWELSQSMVCNTQSHYPLQAGSD